MQTDWLVNLEQRLVTHQPTGLIFSFNPSQDGSGAMCVDTPNPEALPPTMQPNDAILLAKQAWNTYAMAAEITFDTPNNTSKSSQYTKLK